MNNYPNFINFKNMYDNKEVKSTTDNLYDVYNGFIRGNMFKNLYDSYKIKEPFEIKPMNEQAEILTKINSLGFAMIDLDLYLDIYSNDTDMINLYNQFRSEKERLQSVYESKYGPLTLNSEALNTTPWAWNNMPWPWES